MRAYRFLWALVFLVGLMTTSVVGNPPQEDSETPAADTVSATDSAPVQADVTETVSSPSPKSLPWVAYVIPFFGVLGLIYTYYRSAWVGRQEVGSERMAGIAANITEGAMSFLRAEYSILTLFVIVVACLLGYAGTQGDQSNSTIPQRICQTLDERSCKR